MCFWTTFNQTNLTFQSQFFFLKVCKKNVSIDKTFLWIFLVFLFSFFLHFWKSFRMRKKNILCCQMTPFNKSHQQHIIQIFYFLNGLVISKRRKEHYTLCFFRIYVVSCYTDKLGYKEQILVLFPVITPIGHLLSLAHYCSNESGRKFPANAWPY